MGMTMAVAAPSAGVTAIGHHVTVNPCGADGPITIDLGIDDPDHSPMAMGHECEWCQSFGVTTVPVPGILHSRADLSAIAELQSVDGVNGHCQLSSASYLSRAPPV